MSRKKIQVQQIPKKVKNMHFRKSLTWRDIYTSKWFLPLAAVFALSIILALRLITALDIGFHLRGGQWILENMSFHKNDVFTYTVTHNEYIAMYWLYQILLYVLFTLVGYTGLAIINPLMIVFVFLLIFLRMKSRNVPVWLSTIAIFLAVVAMETRFVFRPEVVTWIFFLLTLIILNQYVHNKKNYLFWLPIIQVFWVNFHGLFVLGWIVAAMYLISIWIHERKFNKTLLKWFIISVLVSLVNPYFFKGITFPFYLFTRLQGSSVFKNMIGEFKSPWAIRPTDMAPFFPALSLYCYYLITFASFILALVTYKKRKVHEYLALAAFFYISATAVRNIPLFIIVAIQLIAVSVHDIVDGFIFKLEKITTLNFLGKYTPIAFFIVTILFSARIITGAYYVADRRIENFGVGLDRYTNPIESANFIVRNNLTERVLNDLNSGSWLIWKLPQPVFIDGRLEVMKENFFQEYTESFSKGGLRKLIDKYEPKMILFDHWVALNWHIQLRTIPEWRLIYYDEKSALYAHHDYAQRLPVINFIEVVSKKGIDTIISDDEVWKILKTSRKSKFTYWIEGFFKKQHRPAELMKMGVFAYLSNEFRSAELLYLEFLKKTRGKLYEVYFNLGSLYYRNKDYNKALYCYERVLSEHPENVMAKRRVHEIKRRYFFNPP